MATDHTIGNKKPNSQGRKEWGEFAATTMRLNSQVRQYDGFGHRGRVFGRAQKMAIAAVDSPHFEDFTNPVEAPTAKTHHLSGMIRQVRNR